MGLVLVHVPSFGCQLQQPAAEVASAVATGLRIGSEAAATARHSVVAHAHDAKTVWSDPAQEARSCSATEASSNSRSSSSSLPLPLLLPGSPPLPVPAVFRKQACSQGIHTPTTEQTRNKGVARALVDLWSDACACEFMSICAPPNPPHPHPRAHEHAHAQAPRQSTQHTAHSTQHTAHSTQHTTHHTTQRTAHSCCPLHPRPPAIHHYIAMALARNTPLHCNGTPPYLQPSQTPDIVGVRVHMFGIYSSGGGGGG